ncbi:MAG: VCBS repeat-containing protein [Crocinitomicaceae bacterium]|nr:VCBS repeat-containing protein [Crocinitomicaceae bacterium]
MHRIFFSISLLFFFCAELSAQQNPLFTSLDPKKTKVDFQNTVIENDSLNYFYYDNLYNGAGLAMGDINNDGLPDLYFVSNLGADQLYLNKGKMKFKNITESAFVNQDKSGWHTAVSMADVNADGWLDIYVCKHGLGQTDKVNFRNLLYINNRDNTFTEKAKEYGIDDPGRSIDADFLDYDQDGDLDLFVTNHRENTCIMDQYLQKPYKELFHSNRLYRNDGDKFTEITKASGVLSFGFCLASSVGDINNDGWPDIYVTSDYGLPDFLFINQQNGKFKNEARERLRHTSHYSMGLDIADFNNDLFADICVLDMSNKDYAKSKTNMGSMNVPTFWDNVAKGYNYQYMYNTLQMNLGSGYFSEIGHMAGIASTDWSWAPLLIDLDQDGLKDLYATNGYFRDVRDQDFTRILKEYMATKPEKFDCMKMLSLIPQTKEVNYFFKNKGNLEFDECSAQWGSTAGTNSHGAVAGDLDLDGDIDLVVNNLNEPAQILQNNLSADSKNYLKIKLTGPELNPFAYGTKVIVRFGDTTPAITQELNPSRGYASSSEPQLLFGIFPGSKIESVEIIWNSREISYVNQNIPHNGILEVKYADIYKDINAPLYLPPAESKNFFKIKEEPFDDYATEVLLPHKMSELGPFFSKGDIVGDGLEDFYVGGSRNRKGRLYMQTSDEFILTSQPSIEKDSMYEDAGSVFFDADHDGDQDLYVVSGGNEYKANTAHYQDRLYLNDGKGNFTRDFSALPEILSSGQKVLAHDIDSDGDQDIIRFGRQVPGFYLLKPESYVLINNKGKFENKTKELAPELQFAGMITDAVLTDGDNDKDADLIIVGEWMQPMYFQNTKGVLKIVQEIAEGERLFGWWNTITETDMNNDGIPEYLLGNTGRNNKFHPTREFPLSAHLEDFDKSGTMDLVLTKYFAGVCHPVRGRGCLSDQIPSVKERFKTYDEFAKTPIDQVFNFTSQPESVSEFSNGYLKLTDGKFTFFPFYQMGQIGSINKFIEIDLNSDGYMDFIALGNKYEAEIETPRYDANPGLIFLNKSGSGEFNILPLEQNGPYLNKNTKDAILIGDYIFVANSGEGVDYLKMNY